MNNLTLSVLMAVVGLFHLTMGSFMRKGNVKTGFCAVWCMDTVTAICGTAMSFVLYRYVLSPYLTVRNGVVVMIYLLLTLAFIWMAPSGITLLVGRRNLNEEEVLRAELRLNETLGIVRNCFFVLLFVLPILFQVIHRSEELAYLMVWKEAEICGGLCFIAFLILVPVSVRQAIFWLKNLADSPVEAEKKILEQYRMKLQYKHKNWILS